MAETVSLNAGVSKVASLPWRGKRTLVADDSLTILQEKTKGNLTDKEQTLLQNVLFELRMLWIEITNAIASGAAGKPGGPGGPGPGPIGGIRK